MNYRIAQPKRLISLKPLPIEKSNGIISYFIFGSTYSLPIRLMVLLLILLSSNKVIGTSYFSVTDGNWNAPGTWSNSVNGIPLTSGFPVAGDIVTIDRSFQVTVTSDAACNQLTISNNNNNSTTKLTVNSSITLNIDGAFSINGGNGQRYVSLVNNGTIGFGSSVTFGTSNTSYTIGTNCTFVYYGGNQTVPIISSTNNYYNLTLSGSGTKTFSGTTTINGNLSIASGVIANLGSLTDHTSSNTLTLSGSGQPAGTWGGTASTAKYISSTYFGTTTAKGILNVSTSSCSGGSWIGGVNSDWNNGTNWCDGNVPKETTNVTINPGGNQPVISMANAQCKDITINAGAILSMSGNYTLTIGGNATNSGSFSADNPSTVIYNVSTGGQTIMGGTYYNLQLGNTSKTQTAGGSLTVNGTLTTATGGILDMGSNYILGGTLSTITNNGVINTSVPTSISPTPLPSGKTWTGTVNYNAASGGQTIMGGTYYNLQMGNTSGTQTAGGSLTVNGTLTTTAGGVLDMGSNYILSGTLFTIANNGIINTSVPTSVSPTPLPSGKTWTGTVNYNAPSGSQTILGGSYATLTLGNTSGTQTASGSITANTLNNLNASATLDMGINTLGVITVNNSGTIKTQNTSAAPLCSCLNWGGTVNYYATAGDQTLMEGIYNNLVLGNSSGTQSAKSDLTINGNLTVTSGSTLDMRSYRILQVTGIINNNGTIATQNTSTTPIPTDKTWSGELLYNGTSPQTAVAGSYNNLSIDNPQGVYLSDIIKTVNVNGKLWIKKGKLEIGTQAEVIAGSVQNDAGTSGILIRAGSNSPNGTFIFSGTAPLGSVEMYSKASWDKTDLEPNNWYKWQFFGIPVQSLPASPTFDGAYVRKWNETGNANNYWIPMQNESILSSFQGYEICQKDPTTLLYQGKLENSDFNSGELSFTDGATYSGQHIFANPYTAAIDISKLDFGDNTEHTVYLYNTGSYQQWSNNNGVGTPGSNAGQYIAVPQIPSGNDGLPRQVPSMQAMLVKAKSSTGNATFGISYHSVIVRNSEQQRVKTLNVSETSDKVCTVIDVQGTNFSDRIWIFTDPSCSHYFDNGWDGSKIMGSALSPQLYAVETDGNYQVDAVDDMNNTNIGFQPGQDVNYTLTFTHSNIRNKYEGIYLRDNLENTIVDITESGSRYSFLASSTYQTPNRFAIITRPYEQNAPDHESGVKMFTGKNTIMAQNYSSLTGDLMIYDIAGHYLKKAALIPGGITTITGVIPGAYVVKAITGKDGVTKQLIVQ